MATQIFTFSGKAGDGKTLQVDLAFECSGSGVGSDSGMGLYDLGVIRWKYNIDDLLLVPATVDVVFADVDGNLEPWFTNVGLPGTLESERIAKVTITYDNNVEYIGYMIPETLEIYSKRLIKFKASPRIDILNEYMIYDKDDDSLMGGDPFYYSDWYYYNVVSILEDIYQIVNPSISYSGGSLIIDHNWSYLGYRESDNYQHEFSFNDIKQNSHYLFFDRSYGYDTLGDVLRKYASDWACFTGMLHEGKAFFRKFYYYNPNDTQTLTGVLTHKKTYYNPVSYVKVTDLNGAVHEVGTYTTMPGKYIDRTTLPFINWSHSNIKASYYEDSYWIRFVKEPLVYSNQYSDYHKVLAEYLYYVQGDLSRCRIDEFECYGLNFDFLKSITYGGYKYQIIEMEKDYLRCKTDIKALYMGAV